MLPLVIVLNEQELKSFRIILQSIIIIALSRVTPIAVMVCSRKPISSLRSGDTKRSAQSAGTSRRDSGDNTSHYDRCTMTFSARLNVRTRGNAIFITSTFAEVRRVGYYYCRCC